MNATNSARLAVSKSAKQQNALLLFQGPGLLKRVTLLPLIKYERINLQKATWFIRTPLDEKNVMRRIIKPTAVELSVSCMGWHVCRHTHLTLAEELGMALSDRQAQMGHGDYRMTMLYTHSDLERRRQTLDLMANRLLGLSSDAVPSDTDQPNVTPRDGASLRISLIPWSGRAIWKPDPCAQGDVQREREFPCFEGLTLQAHTVILLGLVEDW